MPTHPLPFARPPPSLLRAHAHTRTPPHPLGLPRRRSLACVQCNGIKSFIVNLVIARSSDEAKYRAERLFNNKLNVILVQIVKQEWPHNWPSFISDIVNASKTNETLCENNMIILKLLSEEVRVHAQKKPSQAAPVASTHGLNPRPGLTAPALSLHAGL